MKKIALIAGGLDDPVPGIARALAGAGYNVALCGPHGPNAAAPLLARLKSAGADAAYVQADIARREDRFQLLQAVQRRFDGLHLLVHVPELPAAGFSDPLETDEETFLRTLRTVLHGPFFLTQAAARWMIEQREAYPAYRGLVIFVHPVGTQAGATASGTEAVMLAGLRAMAAAFASRLTAAGLFVREIEGPPLANSLGERTASAPTLGGPSDLLGRRVIELAQSVFADAGEAVLRDHAAGPARRKGE